MTKNISLRVFSFIFGIFLMGANAVTIILPMRLVDQGLSYDKIGIAMSMMALGMFLVKPVVGRHSDIIGAKAYVLISLALGGVALFLLSLNSSTVLYLILNCMVGLSRGMFTAIASAYTVTISDEKTMGSSFGNLIGISTLFTCAGGIFAGILYPIYHGSAVLLVIAVIYAGAFFAALKYLPNTGKERAGTSANQKLFSLDLFRRMDKRIYIFCLIVFLQQFTTGPLWNTFVPLHFYVTFAFSSTLVGILMSMDELVGSPTSFFAGKLSDKMNDRTFLTAGFVLAGISAICLFFAKSPFGFMILFLICGCFVTCTQTIIPKVASGFMESNTIGFQFAIISTCGGIGDWLGNSLLGGVVKEFSVNYVVLIFFISYILIAILAAVGLRTKGGRVRL